jgi:hypothetical protein
MTVAQWYVRIVFGTLGLSCPYLDRINLHASGGGGFVVTIASVLFTFAFMIGVTFHLVVDNCCS